MVRQAARKYVNRLNCICLFTFHHTTTTTDDLILSKVFLVFNSRNPVFFYYSVIYKYIFVSAKIPCWYFFADFGGVPTKDPNSLLNLNCSLSIFIYLIGTSMMMMSKFPRPKVQSHLMSLVVYLCNNFARELMSCLALVLTIMAGQNCRNRAGYHRIRSPAMFSPDSVFRVRPRRPACCTWKTWFDT